MTPREETGCDTPSHHRELVLGLSIPFINTYTLVLPKTIGHLPHCCKADNSEVEALFI